MSHPDHGAALRLSLMSVCANTVLAIVKGIAGVMGNSQALVADAIESALDVFSGLTLVFGLRVAARPADEKHPWGYGKAEQLAGVIEALVLLGGAAAIAATSIYEIMRPHHTPEPYTLAVLAIVIILKESLFRTVMRGADSFDSTALSGDAWHHRSDAITSGAAAIGIGIAIWGGPGWAAADDWAALLACIVIVFNGLRILRKAAGELMDKVPDPATEQAVRKIAQGVDGVHAIETCLVRKSGLVYLVDMHVEVDGDMPVREGHRIAHEVKDAVKAAIPQVQDVLVHIEPAE